MLLIQPSWDGLSYRRKIKVNERAIHPIGLGVVAALSGAHDIRLVYEALEPAPASARGFDLVGLSVNTFNAPRVYRLADRYRAEGVPVVLGGPHTALLPEECLAHADAIVIGDAEDTWPRVLEDAAARRLQPRYRSSLESGAPIPAPRRDLFHHSSRRVAYCQISRGCANHCLFCYLQYMSTPTLRLRSPGAIADELRALPQEIILFVDDNVFSDPAYAKEVFSAVTPLGKRWWIQAPTTLHQDDALIPLMARSGCFSVSIGFQTASNLTAQRESILQNRVEDYGALVQSLRRAGILVDGTFIFGFDSDDSGTFEATADLIRRLELDTYTFYFLTPYPGTDYFAQFEREGRLLHRDWSRYDWDHVVVRPRQMAAEEVREQVRRLYQRLDRSYFLKNGLRHLFQRRPARLTPALGRFLAATGWSYYWSPILPQP